MKQIVNDRNWSEMSYSKFNPNGRNHWYESEDYCERELVFNYGTIENINTNNCYGVEDIWEMIEEYN